MGSVVDKILRKNHVGDETLVLFYSRGVLIVPIKPERLYRNMKDSLGRKVKSVVAIVIYG